MATDFQKLLPRLFDAPLPVLDVTLQRFERLLELKTTNHQHLAEIIRADIGFSLAMFRTINARLPVGREPVETIEHAISMMGVPGVQRLGAGLTRIDSLDQAAGKALADLYSRALHASQYFEAMAIQLRLPHAVETAKNLRLMHLGEVVLWTSHADQLDAHPGIDVMIDDQLPDQLPRAMLDQPLRDLGLGLAKHWHLPHELETLLLPPDEDDPRSIMVNLADCLAMSSGENWLSDTFEALLMRWSALTEIPLPRLHAIMHRLAAETARNIDGRHLPIPAFYLPVPTLQKAPFGSQEEARPAAEKQAKPPSQSQPQEDTADPAMPAEAAARTSKADKPVETAARKAAATGQQAKKKTASPLQTIMTRQMKSMREHTAIERVMFAMLTADRKKINVRFVLGGDKSDSLRSFSADLGRRSLFSMLMEKAQGIHLNSENHAKYVQLIPEIDRKSFNTGNLFAMSIYINEKPIGLFVADSRQTALSTVDYQHFKSCCRQAVDDILKLSRKTS